jgi:hypothetical protein
MKKKSEQNIKKKNTKHKELNSEDSNPLIDFSFLLQQEKKSQKNINSNLMRLASHSCPMSRASVSDIPIGQLDSSPVQEDSDSSILPIASGQFFQMTPIPLKMDISRTPTPPSEQIPLHSAPGQIFSKSPLLGLTPSRTPPLPSAESLSTSQTSSTPPLGAIHFSRTPTPPSEQIPLHYVPGQIFPRVVPSNLLELKALSANTLISNSKPEKDFNEELAVRLNKLTATAKLSEDSCSEKAEASDEESFDKSEPEERPPLGESSFFKSSSPSFRESQLNDEKLRFKKK